MGSQGTVNSQQLGYFDGKCNSLEIFEAICISLFNNLKMISTSEITLWKTL